MWRYTRSNFCVRLRIENGSRSIQTNEIISSKLAKLFYGQKNLLLDFRLWCFYKKAASMIALKTCNLCVLYAMKIAIISAEGDCLFMMMTSLRLSHYNVIYVNIIGVFVVLHKFIRTQCSSRKAWITLSGNTCWTHFEI